MTCSHHLLNGDTGDKRDYNELHGVKGAYKRLKGVIKGDSGLQRVKEDYRLLEWVTKALQEVARGLGDYDGLTEREQKLFQRSQGVAGGNKGLQGIIGSYMG